MQPMDRLWRGCKVAEGIRKVGEVAILNGKVLQLGRVARKVEVAEPVPVVSIVSLRSVLLRPERGCRDCNDPANESSVSSLNLLLSAGRTSIE